jgi:hypothetical protein
LPTLLTQHHIHFLWKNTNRHWNHISTSCIRSFVPWACLYRFCVLSNKQCESNFLHYVDFVRNFLWQDPQLPSPLASLLVYFISINRHFSLAKYEENHFGSCRHMLFPRSRYRTFALHRSSARVCMGDIFNCHHIGDSFCSCQLLIS